MPRLLILAARLAGSTRNACNWRISRLASQGSYCTPISKPTFLSPTGVNKNMRRELAEPLVSCGGRYLGYFKMLVKGEFRKAAALPRPSHRRWYAPAWSGQELRLALQVIMLQLFMCAWVRSNHGLLLCYESIVFKQCSPPS